jgi:nucleotide-binding universal stress UspA family protein
MNSTPRRVPTPDATPPERCDLSCDVRPRRILVLLDGTATAESVLRVASRLASTCNAELVLLRVVPDAQWFAAQTGAYGFDPMSAIVSGNDLALAVRDQAVEDLTRRTRQLTAQGLRARFVLRMGPVTPTVLRYAEQCTMDLIALAVRPRSRVARLFHGDHAYQIIHRSDRPVLVVPSCEGRAPWCPPTVLSVSARLTMKRRRSLTCWLWGSIVDTVIAHARQPVLVLPSD